MKNQHERSNETFPKGAKRLFFLVANGNFGQKCFDQNFDVRYKKKTHI